MNASVPPKNSVFLDPPALTLLAGMSKDEIRAFVEVTGSQKTDPN